MFLLVVGPSTACFNDLCRCAKKISKPFLWPQKLSPITGELLFLACRRHGLSRFYLGFECTGLRPVDILSYPWYFVLPWGRRCNWTNVPPYWNLTCFNLICFIPNFNLLATNAFFAVDVMGFLYLFITSHHLCLRQESFSTRKPWYCWSTGVPCHSTTHAPLWQA